MIQPRRDLTDAQLRRARQVVRFYCSWWWPMSAMTMAAVLFGGVRALGGELRVGVWPALVAMFVLLVGTMLLARTLVRHLPGARDFMRGESGPTDHPVAPEGEGVTDG